ncbi:MAG: patatin-like phospholipase family protein [Burkholderiales bacterium]
MKKKIISLALQGGGSHGAFTWGVLDRLLEDGRIDIEGISGASAGAVNAVVLAHGYVVGGRDGAREALRTLWESIAAAAPFTPDALSAGTIGEALTGVSFTIGTQLNLLRHFSPSQLNPFNLNPLRDLLSNQVDFERLGAESKIKLFIAATHVRSGTPKIFENQELTLKSVLASACLPFFNQAVEIDGEAYWDGGLTANPPIFPLIYSCSVDDILVVLLSPSHRPEVPTEASDIRNRFAEISMGATFFTEINRIALAKQDAQQKGADGRLDRRFRDLNLHLIEAQDLMSRLHPHSKLNTRHSFFDMLHEQGRTQAELWLENHFQTLGKRSSYPAALAPVAFRAQ